MNNVYLDIETIPCQSPEYAAEVRKGITAPGQFKKQDSIDAWVAENGDAAAAEIVSKTSFDPALGHICCIGWAIDNNPARYYNMTCVEDEAAMIQGFFHNLPTLGQNRFIGHYITGFDLRFILCRAVVLGVRLPHSITFPRDVKPWGENVFDTMTAWAGPRDRISQDNLCRALGLDCKSDMDGSMVAAAWASGEHDRIAAYCLRDVDTVRDIHSRFEFVGY
jgi:DNA polymerase elongation subunit (family B)